MELANRNVLLDTPIGCGNLVTITGAALSAIEARRPQIVFACANPHSLVTSFHDPLFKAALLNADQVVADGSGVTMMAKMTGVDIGPRITGTDYFFSVMNALNQQGGRRVFFFGSSEKVLSLIANRLGSEFPRLNLCGMISPPFRAWSDEENDEMIVKINSAKPDLLWVGMTAPKQEKWVYQNRDKLKVPVIGSIGAVFDFYAGTYPRAPRWMCKYGFEWLYRLIREPRRMWRRNFVSTPKFIFLVLWKNLTQAR